MKMEDPVEITDDRIEPGPCGLYEKREGAEISNRDITQASRGLSGPRRRD
jgi:hypothetical protein